MNGTFRQSKELLAQVTQYMAGQQCAAAGVTVIVCPPATMLSPMANKMRGRDLRFAGQDCHVQPSGAFTGDISAEMLADAGAEYVLVGHSERRQHHQESSALVSKKAEAATRAGLIPIICIGETLEQREAGETEAVLAAQIAQSLPSFLVKLPTEREALVPAQAGSEAAIAEGESGARGSIPLSKKIIAAYEPVWAIGTGKVASNETIAETHRFIKSRLPEGVKLLYGGSVNAENAEAILGIAGVDGVLVGGASLKPESFNAIIGAAIKRG